MPPPERRDKNTDYGYFACGVLFLPIGSRFFFGGAMSGQYRLFTAICFIVGVVILATAPRHLWRFPSLCTSMMIWGGFSALYGVLVAIIGESGGPASHPIARITGLYALILGAILTAVGFVLKKLYSVLKP